MPEPYDWQDPRDYEREFEEEARDVQKAIERHYELSWIRRNGPMIACIVAVVGTILLLSFGMTR